MASLLITPFLYTGLTRSHDRYTPKALRYHYVCRPRHLGAML
jgi:hypothetical protein